MPEETRRGTRWLAILGALLVANSAYLASEGDPHMIYFASVALHFFLGVAVTVPFAIWWWRRRTRPGMLPAGLLLFAAALSGIALVWVGNTRPMRPLLWTHIALSVVGLLALLWALRGQLAPRTWRLAAAGVAAALLVPALATAFQSYRAKNQVVFENPPASLVMQQESMGGKEGPFFPSSVHTSNKDVVPSRIYMDPQSCGRSGCHPGPGQAVGQLGAPLLELQQPVVPQVDRVHAGGGGRHLLEVVRRLPRPGDPAVRAHEHADQGDHRPPGDAGRPDLHRLPHDLQRPQLDGAG